MLIQFQGLLTISQEVGTLAVKAREGKLQPQEFQASSSIGSESTLLLTRALF